MFDPAEEPPLTLAEATKLPWLKGRGGKRPHVATLHRWVARGVRGHKLETFSMGGQRVTSEARLKKFFAELSDAPAPAPTSSAPDVEAIRAAAVLDAAGI